MIRSITVTLSLLLCSSSFAQVNDNAFYNTVPCEKLVYVAPEMVPFSYNTKCKTEAYPFLTADGNHLYYTNNQTKDWVFYTTKDALTGEWSVPVPVQIDGLNYDFDIKSCYLTVDMNTLYISGDQGLYRCRRNENSMSSFTDAVKITVKDNKIEPFTCISLTPDGKELIAYTGASTQPNRTMHRYRWASDEMLELVDVLSSSKGEMGVLSLDGLRYFYSNDEHTNVLFYKERANTADPFPANVFIYKTFASDLNINQLRMTANEDEFVLVLSADDWSKNDIFFWKNNSGLRPQIQAVKAQAVSAPVLPVQPVMTQAVSEPQVVTPPQPVVVDSRTPVLNTEVVSEKGNNIFKADIGQPFPNPSNSAIYFYYHVDSDLDNNNLPSAVVMDQSGKAIIRQPLTSTMGEAKIDVSGLADGIYLLEIQYLSNESSTIKFVVGRQ